MIFGGNSFGAGSFGGVPYVPENAKTVNNSIEIISELGVNSNRVITSNFIAEILTTYPGNETIIKTNNSPAETITLDFSNNDKIFDYLQKNNTLIELYEWLDNYEIFEFKQQNSSVEVISDFLANENKISTQNLELELTQDIGSNGSYTNKFRINWV